VGEEIESREKGAIERKKSESGNKTKSTRSQKIPNKKVLFLGLNAKKVIDHQQKNGERGGHLERDP